MCKAGRSEGGRRLGLLQVRLTFSEAAWAKQSVMEASEVKPATSTTTSS